jgi:hypothetical protein
MDRFGYKIRFLHRRQLVGVLFDNLRDKSKVLTPHAVEIIELLPNVVMTETMSGIDVWI